MQKLGNLEKLTPRDIWGKESSGFTPWLKENISLLGDLIKIKFENMEAEARAGGKYPADIVADIKEYGGTNIGKAIIENQLTKTDHKHLGQIITYASTHKANFILWVVPEFNEQHRKAVDWLNENRKKEINFFLIQVEIYKIDDSLPAPNFTVVCKPENYFSKKLSETKQLQLNYWEQFNATSQYNKKPQPRYWYTLYNINKQAWLALTVKTKEKQVGYIGCEVGIYAKYKNKDLFNSLCAKKDEIEEGLKKELGNGIKIAWERQDEKNFSLIQFHKDGDWRNKKNHSKLHQWHIETANAFAKVFQPYLSGN